MVLPRRQRRHEWLSCAVMGLLKLGRINLAIDLGVLDDPYIIAYWFSESKIYVKLKIAGQFCVNALDKARLF